MKLLLIPMIMVCLHAFSQDTPSMSSFDSSMVQQGRIDAQLNYRPSAPVTAVVLTSIFGSCGAGIIPALACASSAPREANLRYPNPKLMQNIFYADAYRKEARKIKLEKIWVGWATILGMNIVAIAYFATRH